MTDKQAIIDDLKEMIYKLQIECVEKTDNILALGDQLKTAETVIEILEAKIEGHEYAISDIVKEYQEKLDKLKTENEKLKRTNKIYEQGIARHKDEKNNLKKENNSIKETIDGLLSVQYKLADNCVKYSQTLAEIKEIAYDGYNNGQTSYATVQCEKIINTINEVENES